MLEDHFQLILILFAPLYWLWDNVRVLLISQSFIMVFASYTLYLLAKKITESAIFSFAICFSYLFFIGTQFAILNEFHQVTVAPLFIALLYYALARKNLRLYFYTVLGLLITKEDMSLLIASIGFGLLFSKNYKKIGLITFLSGVSSFFFLVYFYMPLISFKGVYDHFHFGAIGASPLEIISNIFKNPLLFFKSLVIPIIKLRTLFISFFTFAFLPIFAPLVYLLPLIQDISVRFIYAGPQYTKWELVNHHAATGAMLLAIAAIYGTKLIKNKFLLFNRPFNYSYFAILLILSTTIANIHFHGPINSIFKGQFYKHPQWVKDNDKVISSVPIKASVAAQNNLVPHLTHRDSIYRLPFGLNSEYMVFDLADGPNKYAPLSHQEIKDFFNQLIETKRYSIIKNHGQAFLLKRNFKTDITKSKYYNDTRYCYYSFEER